jgi:hypothetical protein
LTSSFDVEYLDVKIPDGYGGRKMRLTHPDLHTETRRLRERELRDDTERRRQEVRLRAPLGRGTAALGGWLRALADRLDPEPSLDRAVAT